MNPVQKALSDITEFGDIPAEVLEIVFSPPLHRTGFTSTSVSDQILTQVIHKKVFRDCNLVGGEQEVIPVDGLDVQIIDNYTRVYHVPKNRTGGRNIVSVNGLIFGLTSITNSLPGSAGNTFTPQYFTGGTSQFLALSANNYYQSSNPLTLDNWEAFIVGPNTIAVKGAYILPANTAFRVYLENDKWFSSLPPRAWINFSHLCDLATKAYIYKHRIKVNKQAISHGFEVDSIRDVISEYSDAAELYSEFLKGAWSQTAKLSDPISKANHIKAITGRF